MTVTITASVLTMNAPASVNVVLDNIPAGHDFVCLGSADGFTWPVAGGVSTGTGSQIVLPDNRTPINGSIAYTLVVDGVTYNSNTVEVDLPGYTMCLQSMDGTIQVPILDGSTDDTRTAAPRVALYFIPGRATPVTRYDVLSSEQGKLSVDADAATTTGLRKLLASGAPIVVRSTPGLLDVPPSQIVHVNGNVQHALYSLTVARRTWDLPYVVVDDPQPSVAAIVFTWDEFDTIYSTFTWDSWDTEWAASTWDQFDAYDFGQRL